MGGTLDHERWITNARRVAKTRSTKCTMRVGFAVQFLCRGRAVLVDENPA